tara:strand:- start:670 stop:828 length:159 start_codon:yes stop_codon:yes gene_type:complete
MEPKDPSKRHFYISMVKSAIRICAGCALVWQMFALAGALFMLAEVLGVAEEF